MNAFIARCSMLVLCVALSGIAFAQPVEVDLEVRHPNDTVIRISAVEVTDTEVRVDLRVINGNTNTIYLNSGVKQSYITAGEGARLILVAPEGNDRMQVPAQSTIEGKLVFFGSPPQGERLTILFNDTGSDSDGTPNPKIEIALPDSVMAGDSGSAADGSKKN